MEILTAVLIGLGSLFCFSNAKREFQGKEAEGGKIVGLVIAILIGPGIASLILGFKSHEALSVYAAFLVSAVVGCLVGRSRRNAEKQNSDND